MTRYESFPPPIPEIGTMRKWLFVALVLSLLLHAGLIAIFKLKQLENFGYVETARLAPRGETLRNFVLSDVPAENREGVLPQETKPRKPISIPETKPQVPETITEKPNAREGLK